jgi:hypothetical protein
MSKTETLGKTQAEGHAVEILAFWKKLNKIIKLPKEDQERLLQIYLSDFHKTIEQINDLKVLESMKIILEYHSNKKSFSVNVSNAVSVVSAWIIDNTNNKNEGKIIAGGIAVILCLIAYLGYKMGFYSEDVQIRENAKNQFEEAFWLQKIVFPVAFLPLLLFFVNRLDKGIAKSEIKIRMFKEMAEKIQNRISEISSR